jgi:glycosyltransferase involved in cell wall biosynthesis
MKILFLIPDSLESPMGGMGEQCRNVLLNLSDQHEYTVLGSQNQPFTEYTDRKKYYPIESPPIPIGNLDPLLASIVNQTPIAAKAASMPKPDLIHAFDWSCCYAAAILKQQWNVPLILTMQLSISKLLEAMNPVGTLSNVLTDALAGIELMGLIHADKIIQVSHDYAEKTLPVFKEKTQIIPNGIDLKNYLEPKEKFILPGKNSTKMIYLGRLAFMKGVHQLLKSKIPDNIDLIFIGGNRGGNVEIEEEIAQQVKEKANVFYLGPLYGDQKIAALQAADAVIMPSLHEPFGIVALEALASKSILLSSFANGMGDFLTEDIAINCGTTPETIELAIEKFLSLTKEEKQERIEKGVKLCEKFDWRLIAAEIEKIYATFA